MLLLCLQLLAAISAATITCPYDQSYCTPGTWPYDDSSVGGDWWPSRSTNYDPTTTGACAYFVTPNCKSTSDSGCSAVPAEVLNNKHAGQYTAPQGSYYSQANGYLSCGECFEVKCVDSQCTNTQPITVQVADACPCNGNEKWCCADASTCTELPADINGHPHCPKSSNSLWNETFSIHLDLARPTMLALAFGSSTSTSSAPGRVNTMARRVSCDASGNIYWRLSDGMPTSTSTCNGSPCLTWLQTGVVNVAGAGSVSAVDVYGQISQSGSTTTKWYSLIRQVDSSKPQETYGAWATESGVNLIFPFKVRFTNRFGQTVTSGDIAASAYPSSTKWMNMGVQFGTLPGALSPCSLSKGSGASGWGSCGSSAVSSGTTCGLDCSYGYTQVTGTCSDGKWSQTPSCTPNPCTLTKPDTATAWNTCAQTIPSGSDCSFTCEAGYNATTGHCVASVWTSQPTCLTPGSCALGYPAGASAWNTCSSTVSDGQTCVFTCKTGYSPVSGTCTSGTWSKTPNCTLDDQTGIAAVSGVSFLALLSILLAL